MADTLKDTTMPTDYMDMSRGVGQLGEAAQHISQMVAQQRFRQALANQQMQLRQQQYAQQQQQFLQQQALRQQQFGEAQRMNQFRQQLLQAQMANQNAQTGLVPFRQQLMQAQGANQLAGAGAAQARQGLYTKQAEAADYETKQRQALEAAMNVALSEQRRGDEEDELFNIEPPPVNLDRVVAIQSTLPNAETPINLMRNVAQARAMQNPRLRDMIALGTRNPVMNVPAGATPLDVTNMRPGQQTPFRPPVTSPDAIRQRELGSLGNILGNISYMGQPPGTNSPLYGTFTNTVNRIGQLLAQQGGTNQPPSIPAGVIPQPQGPVVGTIEDGYEFLGGNPSDPNSWRKVQ